MNTLLQTVIGLLAIPLAALGIRSMLLPTKMGDAVGLTPNGIPGLSEIRSVLGGLFLASVAMIITGLATDDTTWFLAVAVIMTAAAIGRLISVATDGFTRDVIPPLAIEVVIAGLLVLVVEPTVTTPAAVRIIVIVVPPFGRAGLPQRHQSQMGNATRSLRVRQPKLLGIEFPDSPNIGIDHRFIPLP